MSLSKLERLSQEATYRAGEYRVYSRIEGRLTLTEREEKNKAYRAMQAAYHAVNRERAKQPRQTTGNARNPASVPAEYDNRFQRRAYLKGRKAPRDADNPYLISSAMWTAWQSGHRARGGKRQNPEQVGFDFSRKASKPKAAKAKPAARKPSKGVKARTKGQKITIDMGSGYGKHTFVAGGRARVVLDGEPYGREIRGFAYVNGLLRIKDGTEYYAVLGIDELSSGELGGFGIFYPGGFAWSDEMPKALGLPKSAVFPIRYKYNAGLINTYDHHIGPDGWSTR